MEDGDSIALDHRGTSPMLMRGVDPLLLLKEFLGQPDGLCGGMGGHMHLFAPELLAASSGIVGSSGPLATGFALAAQYLRPGKIALAFFGEGATNQGMLLESLNLAAAWQLPVIFVCKDNDWEITTQFSSVARSDLSQRALGFGLPVLEVDGSDVEAVWRVAQQAIQRARLGGGPTFLHAACVHLDGHFLGDPLLQLASNPLHNLSTNLLPMLNSLFKRKGAPFGERFAGMNRMVKMLSQAPTKRSVRQRDPLVQARLKLAGDNDRLQSIESEVTQEIQQVVEAALLPNPNVDRSRL
jgi:TPP-dependent pyruvate/acetoin dehydrogenase alpha subunit